MLFERSRCKLSDGSAGLGLREPKGIESDGNPTPRSRGEVLCNVVTSASQSKNRTDALMQMCDALQEGKRTGETWCGFVQAFTDGGGRPYVKEQVAILQDHEFDTAATATQARVYLMLDSHLRKFTPPRPAAGKSDKSALWYCEWKPDKA
jgi:hypothetical protein